MIQVVKETKELTNFLRKENHLLREQNKELKDLLQLNREALRASVQFKKGQINFPLLVNLLYEQNTKLHKKIKKLRNDLETGMCKALISQQIAFASSEQEKYLAGELRDKLSKMRRQLDLREKKISDLSKATSGDRKNSFEKILQVCDFNTLTKKLYDQIDEAKQQAQKKNQEAIKYKDQKEELLKLNLILTKQINQLKVISSHSQQTTKSKTEQIEPSNPNQLSKFLNYQKKLIEDDEEDSEDESYLDQPSYSSGYEEPLPSSIPQQNPHKLQISKVPKLELTKAKQIQELIVQKINQDQKKKAGTGTVKQQKYKKLENEVNILRKKICAVLLEKGSIQKQNNFLKRYIKELESRNSILIEKKIEEDENNQWASNKFEEKKENTETLLEICRDVTMNQMLKEVIQGEIEIEVKKNILSLDA